MAKSLAAMGVKTALIDINAEAVEKLAQEIETKYNVSSIGVAASVLDKESLQEAKKIINNKLGSVDYLINGAGGNSPLATSGVDQMVDSDLENLDQTFFGMKMEGFDRVFDLNFKGTILPTMVFAHGYD